MPTYIVLTHFTEQGIRNIKETTKRADAIGDMAKKVGGSLKDAYWAIGRYDSVAILEAPNDEAMVTLALNIGKLGNVRTETLRVFTKAEMDGILSKVN
ncbi:MAG: GYD domain-containing protein [Xanthobacteraceae bacterium]